MITFKSLACTIAPLAAALLAGICTMAQAQPDRMPRKLVMPRYAHVFVIIGYHYALAKHSLG